MDETLIPTFEGPVCPVPLRHEEQVVIGHGSGGRMTHDLIQKIFLPRLSSPALLGGNDFGQVDLPEGAHLAGHLVLSTDSHIVKPLFFPGGDIGRLAICGTVNDVSMSGAIPLYLTAGFIIEEGLPMDTLQKAVESMQAAAAEAGVQVAAGDTKVVEKGKGDGLFINTAGVGWLPEGRTIDGEQAKAGDVVLISGTLGDHGIAIVSTREGLEFETSIESDAAPLNALIANVLAAAPDTRCFRDPTRGGLSSTLNELAMASGVSMTVQETAVPVHPQVRGASEMLGYDVFQVANEGKMVAVVPAEQADAALAAMKTSPYGEDAAVIGDVAETPAGKVYVFTSFGATRIMDMLVGEQLPRIC